MTWYEISKITTQFSKWRYSLLGARLPRQPLTSIEILEYKCLNFVQLTSRIRWNILHFHKRHSRTATNNPEHPTKKATSEDPVLDNWSQEEELTSRQCRSKKRAAITANCANMSTTWSTLYYFFSIKENFQACSKCIWPCEWTDGLYSHVTNCINSFFPIKIFYNELQCRIHKKDRSCFLTPLQHGQSGRQSMWSPRHIRTRRWTCSSHFSKWVHLFFPNLAKSSSNSSQELRAWSHCSVRQ